MPFSFLQNFNKNEKKYNNSENSYMESIIVYDDWIAVDEWIKVDENKIHNFDFYKYNYKYKVKIDNINGFLIEKELLQLNSIKYLEEMPAKKFKKIVDIVKTKSIKIKDFLTNNEDYYYNSITYKDITLRPFSYYSPSNKKITHCLYFDIDKYYYVEFLNYVKNYEDDCILILPNVTNGIMNCFRSSYYYILKTPRCFINIYDIYYHSKLP